MRLESNIDKDRMSSNERIQLKRLDSERSIEVARANADTNQNARIVSQQENQVNQKHEESMNQMQLNRDIEVAKATGQGGTHIEYGTSNKGVNSTRVAKLEQDILNLRSDLKTLDQLQLEGKLTADMYSVRSKDLLKEIELLQIEQSALRNV